VDLRIGERNQGALRRGGTAGHHVNVSVDHAGHDGGGAEVDYARPGGDVDGRSDIDDTVSLDEDDLVIQNGTGFGLQHTAGPGGGKLVARGEVLGGGRVGRGGGWRGL